MFVYDVPMTAGVGQLQIHVPPDFVDKVLLAHSYPLSFM